jgi:hypothetical protein
MPGIFISYRREDSQAIAGRLADRLVRHFGADQVFRDIDTINPGALFAEEIAKYIRACDALIALIGAGWLDVKDMAGRRRLDSPSDFVKHEIAAALQQNKLVIPVLIDGAPMPGGESLPVEIVSLAERNALSLTDARFAFDADKLIAALEKIVEPGLRGPSNTTPPGGITMLPTGSPTPSLSCAAPSKSVKPASGTITQTSPAISTIWRRCYRTPTGSPTPRLSCAAPSTSLRHRLALPIRTAK